MKVAEKLLPIKNGNKFHDRMIDKLIDTCPSSWILYTELQAWIKYRKPQYKQMAKQIALEAHINLDEMINDVQYDTKQQMLLAVRNYVNQNANWKAKNIVKHLTEKTGMKPAEVKNNLSEILFTLVQKHAL